jgi:hypothetical protein
MNRTLVTEMVCAIGGLAPVVYVPKDNEEGAAERVVTAPFENENSSKYVVELVASGPCEPRVSKLKL